MASELVRQLGSRWTAGEKGEVVASERRKTIASERRNVIASERVSSLVG